MGGGEKVEEGVSYNDDDNDGAWPDNGRDEDAVDRLVSLYEASL